MQSERDFQRQWNTMKQLIGAEAQGKRPQAINSTRTLFGIKSHVEEVMEAVAAEDLARAKERIARERQCTAQHANEAVSADDAGEAEAASEISEV